MAHQLLELSAVYPELGGPGRHAGNSTRAAPAWNLGPHCPQSTQLNLTGESQSPLQPHRGFGSHWWDQTEKPWVLLHYLSHLLSHHARVYEPTSTRRCPVGLVGGTRHLCLGSKSQHEFNCAGTGGQMWTITITGILQCLGEGNLSSQVQKYLHEYNCRGTGGQMWTITINGVLRCLGEGYLSSQSKNLNMNITVGPTTSHQLQQRRSPWSPQPPSGFGNQGCGQAKRSRVPLHHRHHLLPHQSQRDV